MLKQFSPIKRDQRFMSLLFIFYVFRNVYLSKLLHSFLPVQILEPFPSSSPFPTLLPPLIPPSLPQTLSKSKIYIQAVPSTNVLCSNAVLITTPSPYIQFFSFFDVLPSALTTTGMTLMLLVFHILLVSLFSSWYLSIFSFCFLLTLMSPGISKYQLWHKFSHSYSLQRYLVFFP